MINPISEYHVVGHDHAMSALSGDPNADEKEESSSHSASLREVSKVNKDVNVLPNTRKHCTNITNSMPYGIRQNFSSFSSFFHFAPRAHS